MNASTWVAPMVSLVDGSSAKSDSEAYRAECEARVLLSWPRYKQREFLAAIDQPSKRGIGASEKVKAAMYLVEPDYVLRLATIPARRAYLDQLEFDVGERSRKDLEVRIRALFDSRRSVASG